MRSSRSRSAVSLDKEDVASVSTQPTVPEGNEDEEDEEAGAEAGGEEGGEEGEEGGEVAPAKLSREDRMAKLRELRLRMVSGKRAACGEMRP